MHRAGNARTSLMFAADCRTLAPEQVPANAVMITDPPYSDHVHDAMTSCAQHGERKGVRQRDAGFASLNAELRSHVAALGARCRWSVVFCDWEGLHGWRDAFAAYASQVRYVRAIPWVRWSMPQLSGDRPPQGSECIAVFGTTERLHWSGPGNLTHFDELCERGQDKHPTAKPLDLMLRIVSYFSDPGDVVLDPCAGRGTTLLAASLLGRFGLGFECDPAEAARAQARLASALSERDAERFARWQALAAAETVDGERRAAVSAKAVARAKRTRKTGGA